MQFDPLYLAYAKYFKDSTNDFFKDLSTRYDQATLEDVAILNQIATVILEMDRTVTSVTEIKLGHACRKVYEVSKNNNVIKGVREVQQKLLSSIFLENDD